jgi:uncharacterized repeat protein (TIGR03837 family)
MVRMQWDLFCRVIDNFGDIGVCWRLAADLGARGEQVRLWVDDATALDWMAPVGAPGVAVLAWPGIDAGVGPGDVVVEAFGCELPEAFVGRMAAATPMPCWINLDYLSAEDFAERAHKLMSPQWAGPGAGLRKWFFYPGFTPRTGGLLREPELRARQLAFDDVAWLRANGAAPRPGERIVSLFCYEPPSLAALLDTLAREPTLLLATAGSASRQVQQQLGDTLRRGDLRALPMPVLSQRDYDHLLWSADLNFVRGEDSFVRAQWAAKPFVWQIYPQHDGVHWAKLDAFLDRFGADPAVRDFWRAWNGSTPPLPDLPPNAPWRTACEAWRTSLLAQADLATQLLDFVAKTR